ncbi:MAG: hypothetical protein K1X71_13030 [Pirellulales bacterium]|nr:hypothetical protein [Pirellulales bacterium]
MFTMVHSILIVGLMQWLFTQEWAGPLIYWLLGYFTASALATGLALVVVWLSRRKPRDAKRLHAGSVTKETRGINASIGG